MSRCEASIPYILLRTGKERILPLDSGKQEDLLQSVQIEEEVGRGRTPQLSLLSICSGKLFASISSHQTTVEVSPVEEVAARRGATGPAGERSQMDIRDYVGISHERESRPNSSNSSDLYGGSPDEISRHGISLWD